MCRCLAIYNPCQPLLSTEISCSNNSSFIEFLSLLGRGELFEKRAEIRNHFSLKISLSYVTRAQLTRKPHVSLPTHKTTHTQAYIMGMLHVNSSLNMPVKLPYVWYFDLDERHCLFLPLNTKLDQILILPNYKQSN